MPVATFAALLLGSASVEAAQVAHDVEKGKPTWSFEVTWTDAEGARHEAAYELPNRLIQQDLQEPMKFQQKQAAHVTAKAVNAWSGTRKGPKVEAKVVGTTVQLSAKGQSRSAIKQALGDAQEVRQQALAGYLDANGYTTIDGKILPDHARHVDEYADDLAPLVVALGGPTDDPRVFGNKALSMVQSIPYEQRAKVSDLYRRPLSVLGRNKGDCDSKTVLFLALMHEAYPDLPVAIVYRPGHAYAALGLERQRGDMRFREDGQVWVGVEPVGPAVRSIGEVRGKSRRRAKLGMVHLAVVE